MRDIIKKRRVGGRLIKTGIAVFITAAICLLLNMPAIFAVITAIVTIEPTASDSLRKGFIRFPASAIGSALAVFFAALFGESALTYTLSAMLTIYFCQQLKLHAGTLVAVLTAIAMIPDIQDNYFFTFLTRLGTTTIGLTVSTAVNFFLLPPKFLSTIVQAKDRHIKTVSEVLYKTVSKITAEKTEKGVEKSLPIKSYEILRREIERTNDLIFYQEVEWRYHQMRPDDDEKLQHLKKEMAILQKMTLHLGNLQYVKRPLDLMDFERNLIKETINYLCHGLLHLEDKMKDEHFYCIYEMDKYLKYEYSSGHRVNPNYFHHFRDKSIVLYEILCIHDSLEELHQWRIDEKQRTEKDGNA